MVKITLEVPEELSEKLGRIGDRLPEFLSKSLEQVVLPSSASIVNAEQVQKNQAAIALLDSWLSDEEDTNEQKLAWNFLKTALDEDRLSKRLLFP